MPRSSPPHRRRALRAAALALVAGGLAVAVLAAVAGVLVGRGQPAGDPVVPASGVSAAPIVAPAGDAGVVEDQFLVYPTEGVTPAELARQLEALGATVLHVYADAADAVAVRADESVVARIEASGVSGRTEPDTLVYLAAPGSQSSPRNDGLDRIDQPSGTDGWYRWQYDGTGVDIYVVDSGILASHVEFTGRVAPTVEFVTGAPPGDCSGHGTHVAGLAAGTTTGVAKGARILPVRVFGCELSTPVSTVVAALDWIISNRDPLRPAVVNLSLGTTSPVSILDSAVERVVAAGATAVVAAGNANGSDACTASPGRTPDALTVGSTYESSGQTLVSTFSNIGTCVDLYAPGEVVSSWKNVDGYPTNGTYAKLSGTSMAAPHVAGVAAQYLDRVPGATPREVHEAIAADAVLAAVSTRVSGTDRFPFLQTAAAEFTDTGLPSRVARPTVVPGNEQATVAWRAPARAGASAVRGYVVRDPATGRTWPWSGGDLSLAAGPVTNGVPARYEVAAINALGQGAWSLVSLTSTPTGRPGQPRDVVVTPGNRELVVSWSPPASDGGLAVNGYVVTATPGGGSCAVSPPTTSCTLGDLTQGASYLVTVVASNPLGAGVGSTPVVGTTWTVPDAPSAVEATPGDRQVLVSWAPPPSDGGTAVTRYEVQVTPGGSLGGGPGGDSGGGSCSVTAPATSCVVDGLVNDEMYQVSVAAENQLGWGPWSEPVEFTLWTVSAAVPGMPGQPQLAVSVGALEVVAVPPTTGGTPDRYTVTADPVLPADPGGSCVIPDVEGACVIDGLAPLGTYRVSVVAENEAGVGPAVQAPRLVTPGVGSPTPQFTDVPTGEYYVAATSMLKLRGITTGIGGSDRFDPTGPVNRAQMAAFLYRLAGQPPVGACGFVDLAEIPDWARPAACWLQSQGITTENPYNPGGVVTRAQMAAFLHRLAGQPPSGTCGFADLGEIPGWAQPGACWLQSQGITTENPYKPGGVVTRAQMAAFLYRTGGVLGLWAGVR